MLVLYHSWPSSCSRRVRFCLAEKGLPYESRIVDLKRMEQHDPEYLKLNPDGVVPTLLHDGVPVVESTVINEYLDEAFPEPPLRPTDPLGRARMRVWTKFVDEDCLPALLVCNWNEALRPVAAQWSDDELRRRIEQVPTPDRKEAWRRIARRPFTSEEIAAAREKLRHAARRMEAALADRPFLAGDAISLADINMAPYIRRLEEIDAGSVDPSRHPKLAQWWARLKARPAFAAARMDPFASAFDGG